MARSLGTLVLVLTLVAPPGHAARPSVRAPLQSMSARVRKLPTRVKVGASAGLVAVALGVSGAVVTSSVRQADAEWLHSPSRAVVERVEAGLAHKDLASLQRVRADARAHLAQLEATAGGDPQAIMVQAAAKELPHARLALLRAELAENVLAEGTARLGGTRPSAWQARLAALETQAAESGAEGPLARELAALRTEVHAQTEIVARFDQTVAHFGDGVSRFFSQIRHQRSAARDAVEAFRKAELAPEQALLERLTSAQRERVTVRLQKSSDEFRIRHARAGQLTSLLEGKLGRALELAKEIDAALIFIEGKGTLAAQVLDDKGSGSMLSSRRARQAGEHTVAGRAIAEQIPGKVTHLNELLAALHQDGTVRGEALAQLLPAERQVTVAPASLPEVDETTTALMVQMATGQISAAKARFGLVVEALTATDAAVAARRDLESRWLGDQITATLEIEASRP